MKSFFKTVTTRELVAEGIKEAQAKLAKAEDLREHAELEVRLIKARINVLETYLLERGNEPR